MPVPEAREGETHLPSARTAPPSNPARTLRAYGSTRCRVVRAKSTTVARGDPPGDRRSRSDLRRVLRRFVLLLVPVLGSIMPSLRPRYALHATLNFKLRSLEGSRCQWSSVACHSGTGTPGPSQLEVGDSRARRSSRVAPGRRCGPIRAFQFSGAGCQWASFLGGFLPMGGYSTGPAASDVARSLISHGARGLGAY